MAMAIEHQCQCSLLHLGETAVVYQLCLELVFEY